MFVSLLATRISAYVTFVAMIIVAFEINNPIFVYGTSIGGYAGIFLFIFFLPIIYRQKFHQDSLIRFYLLVSIFSIIYYFLWLLVSFMLEFQHPKDTIGSTSRALLPLLVILLTFLSIKPQFLENFTKRAFILLFNLAILGALVKIFFVINGMPYGWGIHGYSIPIYILSFILMSLTMNFKFIKNQNILLFYLSLMFLASILSLKRGNWVEILLTITLIVFVFKGFNRIKYIIGFVTISALLILITYDSGVFDAAIGRAVYTYQGQFQDGVDSSVGARMFEYDAVIMTIQNQGSLSHWLFGFGPGAGYESYGYTFRNLNEFNQPYGIHSGYMLLLFRYGIIGLAFYLLLIIPVFPLFLYFRKIIVNPIKEGDLFFAILGLSCCIHIFTLSARTFASSGVFSNWEFGIVITFILFCYAKLLNRRRIN